MKRCDPKSHAFLSFLVLKHLLCCEITPAGFPAGVISLYGFVSFCFPGILIKEIFRRLFHGDFHLLTIR